MAVDMFLKIEDPPIKGEAQDDKHKQEIDVLSWSWGMTNSGSAHALGGAGSGKVNVKDLTINKYVDSSTPDLALSTANGQHHKKATLYVRKAGGGNPVEYLKLHMGEVLVTSMTTGGNRNDERLTETIMLNFRDYEVEYTPQKADGTPEASKKTGWDIAANKKK